MQINSLTLKNFKKFDNLEVSFSEDVTLIKGNNEQGKSSLVQGFLTSLFLDPRKKDDKGNNSFRSWNSPNLYSTSLKFKEGNSSFELFKDFEERKVVLKNLETQEEITDYSKIKKILEKSGGYSSPKLYTSTACILQGDLINIKSGQKEIDEALEDLVTSQKNINVNKILKRIDKEINNIERGLKGVAKNPGSIKLLTDKIEKLELDHEGLKKDFNSLKTLKESLKNKYNRKDEILKEAEALEKTLFKTKKSFEIKERLDNLDEKYGEISKKIEQINLLKEEKEDLENKLSGFLFKRDTNLTDLVLKASSLEESFKNLEKEKKLKTNQGSVKTTLYAYLAAALILFTLGILGSFVFIKSFFFLISLIASIPFFVFYIKTKNTLSDSAFDKEGELKKKKRELEEIFSTYQIKTLEELKERIENFQAFTNKYNETCEKIKALTYPDSFDDLKFREKEILKRIGIEESKLSPEEIQDDSNIHSITSHQEKIDSLKKQKEKLDYEINKLEIQIDSFKNSHAELLEAEEELIFSKQKLEKEKENEFILKSLKENLLISKENVSKSFQEIFENTLGEYIKEITDRRYSRVKVSPDLKVLVYSEEAKDFIEPDKNLSQGTLDQIYFIARLAFIKYIFQDKKPLIILDDPFINFDKTRLENSFNIIKKISKEFQVVIFTHSNLFDSMTSNIINL